MSVLERKFCVLVLVCGLLCGGWSNGEGENVPASECAHHLARVGVVNLDEQFRAEFERRKRKWESSLANASRGWWPIGAPNVPFQKQAALARQMEDIAFRHKALETYLDLMNETHSLLLKMKAAGLSDRRLLAEDVHHHIWGEIRAILVQPTARASRLSADQRHIIAERLAEMAYLVNETIRLVNEHVDQGTIEGWRRQPEPLNRKEIERLIADVEKNQASLSGIQRKIRVLRNFVLALGTDTTLEQLPVTPVDPAQTPDTKNFLVEDSSEGSAQ